MGYQQPLLSLRVAGVEQGRIALDIRTVVGPASYASGGLPVDLSAAFSAIKAVRVCRVYTTADKAVPAGWHVEPVEAGTDLYSSGKFRLWFGSQREGSLGDTSAQNPPGGVSLLTSASSTDVPSASVNPTAGVGGSAGSGAHTHPFAGLYQHGHAVTQAVTALSEAPAATNLSAFTVEYEVIGVPV